VRLPVRLPVSLPGLFCGCTLAFARRENTVKKMHRLYQIGGLAGAILLSIGTVLAIGIPEASAQTGIPETSAPITGAWCYPSGFSAACLNAWNGGPWVDVYTNPNAQNDNFTAIQGADGNWVLEDTGGNAWSGECIGDAYNESGKADTSLDPCGFNGTNAGWGTQFELVTAGCIAGDAAFYSLRWHGYLGPPDGWANGSHFYLNRPGEICFELT